MATLTTKRAGRAALSRLAGLPGPVALALGLVLGAAPAAAEMYRCTGPGGEVLFTSDPSQCPGAETHEPEGAVQRHEATQAPPAASRHPRAERAAAEAERARAARWSSS